jgi:hypothetical protein
MLIGIMNRLSFWAFIVIFAICAPILSADVTPEDVEIGKKAAAEVEKEVTLVTDQAVLDHVNAVGQAVAKAAGLKLDVKPVEGQPKPDLQFTFKVIDDDEVNAFALPGGWIYVNKGLLDYVQSDDELASVLAHETGHIMHNHGVKRQQKYERGARTVTLATLLALILAGDKSGEQIFDLSWAAGYINVIRTLEYSQDAELEADQESINVLQKTSYRPVAVLTLMERLARDADRKVGPTLTFVQSHPPSRERVERIKDTLVARGIAFDAAARRAVTKSPSAKPEEVTVGEQTLWRVVLNDHEILTVAAAGDLSSADRAKGIADAINAALDAGMQRYEVAADADAGAITYRGKTIFTVTAGDAALAPDSPTLAVLTAKVSYNLQYAIEKGVVSEL